MSRDSNPDVEVQRPGTLASTFEAGAILGVPRSTISRWLRDGTMPKPLDRPKAGPVWRVGDLVRYKRRRDGLPRPSRDELRADTAAALEAVRVAAENFTPPPKKGGRPRSTRKTRAVAK